MFSLSPVLFATLLAGVAASNPSLAGYEPATNVADHAAGISEDQMVIFDFVAFDSEEAFQTAQDVYEQGGNSKSYADITLSSPLVQIVKKGVGMIFTKDDGTKIYGTAFADTSEGSGKVGFQYVTGEEYAKHVNCKVGGLPSELQVASGCLPTGGSGTVSIDGLGEVNYNSVENKNGRTIQGFSTASMTKFRPGSDLNEPYFPFYEPFVNYYGSPFFADEIVTAALEGTSTNLNNGNIDLEKYGFRARAEVAKKATAYLNVGQYVLREVWDAVHDCDENCMSGACNDDAVHALDEAVAFYVGSEFVTDPNGKGNLYYGFAQLRAANFATAVEGKFGQAEVNRKIMFQFNDMKQKLNARQCEKSKENANEIARLMYIPFIQGTLRYAYFNRINTSRTEKAMAEGAIFAAGILPIVHSCDEDAARLIYDNMRMGSSVDFESVKEAFEGVYKCMNIECSDIGGLVDTSTGGTSYYETAEPCGGYSSLNGPPAESSSSDSDSLSNGVLIGILVGIVVGILLIAFVVTKCLCTGESKAVAKQSRGDVENCDDSDMKKVDNSIT